MTTGLPPCQLAAISLAFKSRRIASGLQTLAARVGLAPARRRERVPAARKSAVGKL